jgi:hypothetical protein
VNAAKNIHRIGLADSQGLSQCVNGSSVAILVSAGTALHSLQQASTRMNPFTYWESKRNMTKGKKQRSAYLNNTKIGF